MFKKPFDRIIYFGVVENEVDEVDRVCSTTVEKRNACGIFVEKPEGKRPLGRPRCRWV
jgi:hypothetical protein